MKRLPQTKRGGFRRLFAAALALMMAAAPAQIAAQVRLSPEISQAGSTFMSRLANAKSQDEMVALFEQMVDYDHFLGEALRGLPPGTQTDEFRQAMRLYLPANAWNYVSNLGGLAFVPEASRSTPEGEEISGQLHVRISDSGQPTEEYAVPFSLTLARTAQGVKLRDLSLMGDSARQNIRKNLIEVAQDAPADPAAWAALIRQAASPELDTTPEQP